MNELLDTRKLRMFVTTVREGSMRKASASLFVTPSALSHGIRGLEESLNTVLFQRNGPVITPTKAGQELFQEAVDILSRLDQVAARLEKGKEHEHVQLHIGTTNTGCSHLFPAIVREFRESFPSVGLKLEIDDPDILIQRLTDHNLDIIIAPVQREYRELTHFELGFDELVFIVHPSHAWARAGKLLTETLSEQKLIIPAVKSNTYNLIDARYREMRVPLEPFIELNNEEAIKQLVSLNIGSGIVPRWIARDEIEQGRLHAFPLSERSLQRRWTVSHRTGVELSFPEFLFIGTTRAVAKNLIQID